MLTAYLAATIFDMSVFDLAASAAAGAPATKPVVSTREILVDYATIAAAIVGMCGLIGVVIQLRSIKKQSLREEQANHAAMMLDLSDRWSEVLSKRYEVMDLLADPINDEVHIEKGFNNDFRELMKSKFWRDKLRPVINFYEFLGLMIHQENITAEEAFVLVSVDHYDWTRLRDEEGKERQDTTFEDGDFYKKVQPYLDLLRDYRNDIYVFYDLYLAELYHKNRLDPFLPSYPSDKNRKPKFNEETCRYYWDRSAA